MGSGRGQVWAWMLLVVFGTLAACTQPGSGVAPDAPRVAPSSPRPTPKPKVDTKPIRAVPLASSDELARRYTQLESRLINNGKLLETSGDLDDLNAETLATNFIRIALYDEYTPVDGQLIAQESTSRLRRWEAPVRLSLVFGASVPPEQRLIDRELTNELAEELTTASGHSVRVQDDGGNFTVFVVNEMERLYLAPYLQREIPGISDSVVGSMLDILPSTFCLVVAFSTPETPQTYVRAVAIIRNEHPPVLRRACFHEEISQGLGLANDSHEARPSIFNDDEEFALLTSHDKLLLRMLYDQRLRPGMNVAEAEPIVRDIAAELLPDPIESAALAVVPRNPIQ